MASIDLHPNLPLSKMVLHNVPENNARKSQHFLVKVLVTCAGYTSTHHTLERGFVFVSRKLLGLSKIAVQCHAKVNDTSK